MKQTTKIAITVALTVVMLTLVEFHVRGLNGPSYWVWPWRLMNPQEIYPRTLLAILPVLIAQVLPRKNSRQTALAIVLLMAGFFASEIVWRICEQTPNLPDVITSFTESTEGTGYFRQAWELFIRDGMTVSNYLHQYPILMPHFYMHPSVRPPAAILFFLPFLRIWPNVHAAAYAAGITIGLLAALSLPAAYFLVKELTGDSSAAFAATSFFALCPGLIGFFPNFDNVYPIFTALLVIPWARALRRDHLGWACVFGLLLALTTLQTHAILMLGAFLGFFSIAWAAYNRENQGWPRLVRASAVAMSVFAGFYVVFWLATGFDPIATFRTALKMQKFILVDELLGPYSRPWPRTVPWDIYDVILGTGWISAWLIACYFISAPKAPPPQPDDAAEQPQSNRSVKVPQRVLCMICLLQPITIAAFHVLPGEAARLYAFMFPLVLVPVGLEISTWPPKYRAAVCACLWILGAAILRNMAFL